MNEYNLIQLDNLITFSNATQEDAEQYFAWFKRNMPRRLKMLSVAIATSSVIKKDLPILDKSPQSLQSLGSWFSTVVETQPASDEFNEKYKKQMGIYARHIKWILSNQTLSLCFDIGIYLGEVLIQNHSQLYWKLNKGDDIDRHQPVIAGFVGEENYRYHINPMRPVYTYALRSAQRMSSPTELYDMYMKMGE